MENKRLARSLKMALIAGSLVASGTVSSAIITMTDGNSTVDVEDTLGSAVNWTVDNTNDLLYTQGYYYRIGDTGPEFNLSGLTLNSSSLLGSGQFLLLSYSAADFDLEFTYSLTGGTAGSGTSVLSQDVEIRNTSNSTLDIHFFQYNDFDLFGSSGQTAQQTNANTIIQTYGTTQLTEQVSTPAPDAIQVDGFPSLVDSLNDSTTTTLNGNTSFSGDATWAWEWNFAIAPGSSDVIGEDLRLNTISAVPVPAAVWLFVSGLIGLASVARRKVQA